MTDDIVTRLRDVVWDIRCSKMDPDDVGDIVDTCLDEIERLRGQLHQTRKLLEQRVKSFGWIEDAKEAWREIAYDVIGKEEADERYDAIMARRDDETDD